jgi:hypothetical protein
VLIPSPLPKEPVMSMRLRQQVRQDLQLAGLSHSTLAAYLRVVRGP